jgi:hypothetical protein
MLPPAEWDSSVASSPLAYAEQSGHDYSSRSAPIAGVVDRCPCWTSPGTSSEWIQVCIQDGASVHVEHGVAPPSSTLVRVTCFAVFALMFVCEKACEIRRT